MSSPDPDLVDALAEAQEAVVNAVVAARRERHRQIWDDAVRACLKRLEEYDIDAGDRVFNYVSDLVGRGP